MDLRHRADAVRRLPLETVLLGRGATRDRHDKSKWHTEQGPVSIRGTKFFDWHRGTGGGGAIDLVMHLAQIDFPGAVAWLEHHGAAASSAYNMPEDSCGLRKCHEEVGRDNACQPIEGRSGLLCLPARDNRKLERARCYLIQQRSLSARFVEPLIESGMLYADQRGNAVFLLLGKEKRPVGAELRGTGLRVWRGMARGTRKDRGFFWIGSADLPVIVLCESAIDAISCFALSPDRLCISTSGARPNPLWLGSLMERGYEIYCGFDSDEPGAAMAREMIRLHPRVKRLCPPGHDWNDVLAARC